MKTRSPLRLADTPRAWNELDETVRECVRAICGRYDDQEQVKSFLTVVDLLTNRKFESGDREMVAFEVRREAFRFTTECDQAESAYMDALVMPLQERKTA